MTITTVARDGTKQCLQEQAPHAKLNEEQRHDSDLTTESELRTATLR